MAVRETPLAVLSAAERALVAAENVTEVKEIYDAAEAYRLYADSREKQNRAATVKLRAAAKGGAMLANDPRVEAGRPGKGNADSLSAFFPNMERAARQQLSSRWQRVARLDELGTLNAYLERLAHDGDAEVTMAGLLHYATLGDLNRSDSPEWYTPKRYVKAARDVLGGIDLDPASSDTANQVVQATRYYTAETKGLDWDWHGRVFLNPPYGRSAPNGNAKFVPKLVEEYEAGRVTAAILLTSAHATDTEWFQLLWDYRLCFTDHRLPYWNESGGGDPTFGSVFTYLGPHPERFVQRFDEFGAIVTRAREAE